MAKRHEAHVAEVLGGRLTVGSGNQWRDQTDGKHVHGSREYAFAWDCKSTLGKSISVTLAAWRKLLEQADDYLPAMPLRLYADERLTMPAADLVVVDLDAFGEILEEANLMAAIRSQGCLEGGHTEVTQSQPLCRVCGSDLR